MGVQCQKRESKEREEKREGTMLEEMRDGPRALLQGFTLKRRTFLSLTKNEEDE